MPIISRDFCSAVIYQLWDNNSNRISILAKFNNYRSYGKCFQLNLNTFLWTQPYNVFLWTRPWTISLWTRPWPIFLLPWPWTFYCGHGPETTTTRGQNTNFWPRFSQYFASPLKTMSRHHQWEEAPRENQPLHGLEPVLLFPKSKKNKIEILWGYFHPMYIIFGLTYLICWLKRNHRSAPHVAES